MAAGIVVAIVLATSSGGSQNARQASSQAATSSHHKASSSGTRANPSSAGSGAAASSTGSTASSSSSGSSGAPAAGTGSSGGSGSPVSAVESFYHLAAAHRYSSAWALADPSFRSQLGGYASFEGGQSADRSITFTSANVTNQSGNTATVNIRTISVRDNGTQHCYGPVNLIRGSSGWLVDHIAINCT